MRYEHTPRPLIEDHYHIRELIENQEVRAADRIAYREKEKTAAERDDLIKDAKWFVLTDFWCDTCKKDFKAQAIKQVEDDWNANQRIAFYKTKCFKGHWCIRLVTDRHKDAFFIRSRLLALDRGNHAADIVQPFETGYNMLYGKK